MLPQNHQSVSPDRHISDVITGNICQDGYVDDKDLDSKIGFQMFEMM